MLPSWDIPRGIPPTPGNPAISQRPEEFRNDPFVDPSSAYLEPDSDAGELLQVAAAHQEQEPAHVGG